MELQKLVSVNLVVQGVRWWSWTHSSPELPAGSEFLDTLKEIKGVSNRITSDSVEFETTSASLWTGGKPWEWSKPGGLLFLCHLLRFGTGDTGVGVGPISAVDSYGGVSDILWWTQIKTGCLKPKTCMDYAKLFTCQTGTLGTSA